VISSYNPEIGMQHVHTPYVLVLCSTLIGGKMNLTVLRTPCGVQKKLRLRRFLLSDDGVAVALWGEGSGVGGPESEAGERASWGEGCE
jgi:hypothetical protein